MKTVLMFVMALSILLGFSGETKETKILFFGDSITYDGTSWEGAYINKTAFLAKTDGFNDIEFEGSGVPGDRVTDLYLRLEKDIISKSPDIVVIFIGVNDIWQKDLSGTGTDFLKFGSFYKSITDKLKSHGIQVVVCTPACIGERTDFTNKLDGDLNRYCQWIREFALEENYALVDLRKAFLEYNLAHNKQNKDKDILTADGVHLKTEGNELVAKEMWKVLKNNVLNKN